MNQRFIWRMAFIWILLGYPLEARSQALFEFYPLVSGKYACLVYRQQSSAAIVRGEELERALRGESFKPFPIEKRISTIAAEIRKTKKSIRQLRSFPGASSRIKMLAKRLARLFEKRSEYIILNQTCLARLSSAPSPTITAAPTSTAAITPQPTATATPNLTTTATPTISVTATSTPTASATFTQTSTPTPTCTATPTPTPTTSVVPSPAPSVAIEPSELLFGDQTSSLELNLQVTSGQGIFSFSLTESADWLELSPTEGVVSDQQPASITATVHRSELAVGSHQASLAVSIDTLASREIAVTVLKPATYPLIIPWLEIADASPATIQHAVAGLQAWQRLTDTSIVTLGDSPLEAYLQIRAAVPGMQIIPSIKTSPQLNILGRSFSSPQGWSEIAALVQTILNHTGEWRLLLENESVLKRYTTGLNPEQLNFAELEASLHSLPSQVRYYWYPGYSYDKPWLMAFSDQMVTTVQDALEFKGSQVGFVDLSFGDPTWPQHPPAILGRATLNQLAELEPISMIYFSGITFHWTDWGWPYWLTKDVAQVMLQLNDPGMGGADRPEAIFYPGSGRWIPAAQDIAYRLWPSE